MRSFVLATALLPFALTAAWPAHAAVPPARMQVWTREGEIRSLEVDGAGFLWTASKAGLCRFDGSVWTCPLATCAEPLHVDASGAVWGCTDATGLVRARGSDVSRVPWPTVEGKSPALIGALGRGLVLATSTGVWTWSPGSPVVRASGTRARLVVPAGDGGLWLGDDRGVRRASAAGDEPLVLTGRAEAMTASRDGRVLAAIFNRGLWELGAGAEPRSVVSGVRDFLVRSLVWDGARNVAWIARQYHLEAYDLGDGRRVAEWGTKEGLPHPVVHAFAHDTSQGLIVGTSQGTAQLRLDDPISTLGRSDGLPGDLAFGLSQGPDGAVWTTSTEGLARWDGRKLVSFDPYPATGGNYLRSVRAARDGTVWVGSPSEGLFELRDGRFEPPRVEGLPPKLHVFSFHEGRDGTLWIGTLECGVGQIVNRRYREVVPPSPTPHCPERGPITDLVEGADGDVWMLLAQRRAGRLRGGQVQQWDMRVDSLPHSATSLAVDRDGAAWVGSAGRGLVRIKNDRVQRVTTANGLWDDHVLGIVEDDHQQMWFTSRNGIFRVERSQLDAFFAGWIDRVTSVPYQVADGLRSQEGTLGWSAPAIKTRDGALWFVTVAGLVRIDPDRAQHPPPLRQVELLSTEVDGRPLQRLANHATAASGELRFEVVAPSLWQPSRVRYRHRLLGWQAEWSAPTRETVARWSGVAAGRYTFQSQAFLLDEPRRIVEADWPLTLTAPWFRQPWFWGLIALAAAAAGANAWRVRQLRLRHLDEAIQADRHRIAQDIHDSLEQDLTGLKMQVEAASAWLDTDAERTRGHLDRAADLVADGLVDARNAVWGLRSAVVPSAELLTALDLRLRRVAEGAGVALAFESVGPARVLPSLAASQLVYIVREAVTNAVKHARPRHVAVQVDLGDPESIRVVVRDDGPGIAATASAPTFAGGMGIDGMHERVRRLGGELEIGTPAGGGTEIKVVAPLRPPRRG